MSYFAPENRDKNIGICEFSSGIGCLVGPAFGSLMFTEGSYCAPLASCATLYLITWPWIALKL